MAEFLPTSRHGEDHWLSVSDMMTVLMVVFLFIAVIYMLVVSADKDKMKQDRDNDEASQGSDEARQRPHGRDRTSIQKPAC